MAVLSGMSEDDHLDMQSVLENVRKLAVLKRQVKALGEAEKEVKANLRWLADTFGEVDGKGHKVFSLPQQVEGIGALQMRRAVSNNLDADFAEEFLKENDLWDECIEMVPVLDDDKVLALRYEGRISDADFERLYPPVESWSFWTIK